VVSRRLIETVRELYSSTADDPQATLTGLVSLLSSIRADGDEDEVVLIADEAATRACVLRQYETAAQLWDEASSLRPSDTMLLFNLAHALARSGRVDAAIAALERCGSIQAEGDPERSLPVERELRRLRGRSS
jgi:predicted Zn-dependent protease